MNSLNFTLFCKAEKLLKMCCIVKVKVLATVIVNVKPTELELLTKEDKPEFFFP